MLIHDHRIFQNLLLFNNLISKKRFVSHLSLLLQKSSLKHFVSKPKNIVFKKNLKLKMADLNSEISVKTESNESESSGLNNSIKSENSEKVAGSGIKLCASHSQSIKKIKSSEKVFEPHVTKEFIQEAVNRYNLFNANKPSSTDILESAHTDSENESEMITTGVQCSENWSDSIFVYNAPQPEAENIVDTVKSQKLEKDPDCAKKCAEVGEENIDQDSKVAEKDGTVQQIGDKRKATEDLDNKELKRAKLETKALKAKRPGFTDERYNETSYYIENGLRKVYPYYFTFTTFTKGRWVGEKILDVFAREFRAHPAEEYERCIRSGSLTVNYERVDVDYKLKHNDLLANVVHRHEVPVTADPISIIHMDEDVVVVNKPASIPVHPCGRYRHNTVVFILAKEYNLKNLRTIHRLDRLTSGLLMFGRTPKKARTMEQQIRNRQVQKEYVCRVEGQFPSETIDCYQPIEVVSYKIGVCKVSEKGKTCSTTFKLLGYHAASNTSVVLCLPHSGRMHQIRVHLQFLGYPVVNDPLYNHEVFGPLKGRGGLIGKTDAELVRDLIRIHNAENWLGVDADLSMLDEDLGSPNNKCISREPSPCEVAPSSPPRLSTCSIPLYTNNNNISSISKKKVTVATQTGHDAPDLSFDAEKLTVDPHCYECKVRYRDPKPQDLVMFLHAWKYRGPGWAYETELPDWARVDWTEPVE